MDNGHNWALELNSVPLLEAVLCAGLRDHQQQRGRKLRDLRQPFAADLGRVLGGCIEGQRAVLVPWDHHLSHNGFTVLVNPDAAGVLLERRRRKIGG